MDWLSAVLSIYLLITRRLKFAHHPGDLAKEKHNLDARAPQEGDRPLPRAFGSRRYVVSGRICKTAHQHAQKAAALRPPTHWSTSSKYWSIWLPRDSASLYRLISAAMRWNGNGRFMATDGKNRHQLHELPRKFCKNHVSHQNLSANS